MGTLARRPYLTAVVGLLAAGLVPLSWAAGATSTDPAASSSPYGKPTSIIDFEPDAATGQLPDGSVPQDEMALVDQYEDSHFVRFGIDTNRNGLPEPRLAPLLEKSGDDDPNHAFRYDALKLYDTAAPGLENRLGSYFLKVDVLSRAQALLVEYRNPVRAASGEIWDIDGTDKLGYEQWLVEALDADRRVLETVLSPKGVDKQFDGKPWLWELSGQSEGSISAIRISFAGRKSIVGLAFDNFSPSLAQATATAAATATPTPTFTRTATASPTTTATREPIPVFLPLTLKEDCPFNPQYADVALVIDASSSMMQGAAGGRTKLGAAKDGAVWLVNMLALAEGDQATIVSFSHDAWVHQELTADLAELLNAIAGITSEQFTRIHLGVDVARRELVSPRHRPGNVRAMIVLSDGRPDPESPDLAIESARLAKLAGIQIVTIGLGPDVDADTLKALASSTDGYFYSPDGSDLDEIFASILGVRECPPEWFWGQRP